MNPATALATVLVDELARHGVAEACVSPGSRSTPLAMALLSDGRIRMHVRIDERSASFTALGLAKATGRPAVLVCTSGTAAANFHPAVLEADAANVPLLVLTADRPPELRATGSNQTVDQIKLYGDAARWFCEVGVPHAFPNAVGSWRSVASRAYAEAVGALGGPPGPVHLNLAFREPLVAGEGRFDEPLHGRAGSVPWTAVTTSTRPPADDDIDHVAEQVQGAERGLLVVGDSAPGRELVALATAAGWPILAEPQSGARSGPNAISTYDLLLRDDAFWQAQRPDLVLTVGRIGLSKVLLNRLDSDIVQILVDRHGTWYDPRRALSRVVTADPALLASAVVEEIVSRPSSGWLEAWREAEMRVRVAIDAELDDIDAPSEPRTARDMAHALPDGSLLVVSSSMPIRDLNTYAAPRSGLNVLASRGVSGIDGFVSTAIGAATGAGGRGFALAGDLSLLHDANGLLPARGGHPSLVMVVVNNDGGGIFSFLPQAGNTEGFETLFGTPHGLDLADFAAAHQVGHRRLERAGDLASTLGEAVAAGGLQLVEVRTNREENVTVHHRLTAAALGALR